ncbi:MAG: aldo/keto reductase [Haloechinothrix sp.]
MGQVPEIRLANGVTIPQLGYGVFQIPPDQTPRAVRAALDAGYRSIDTASAYGNESGVGVAVRESGIPRADLFITTKLWNSDQGYDSTLAAFDRSLTELGMDYVDLYLIHWPLPRRDRYRDTWRALQRVHADGRVRAIGVSNFGVAHLTRLLESAEVVPAVNQIELHPYLPQAELRAFHAEHGIVTEAWSPLAQGELLAEQAMTGLASKYGKSPAQIVLRWHLQLGNVAIPKSVTPSRIRENIDVFDFELADDDLVVLTELNKGKRIGPDPDVFDRV